MREEPAVTAAAEIDHRASWLAMTIIGLGQAF